MTDSSSGKKPDANLPPRGSVVGPVGHLKVTEWSKVLPYEPSRPVIGPPDKVRQSPEQHFLAAVEKAMDGPLLRYSKRMELLALAEELEIESFRANLLIAQTQRRTAGVIPTLVVPQPELATQSQTANWQDRFFFAAAIFIICALADMALIRFVFGGK